jgi:hypothetical protein
MSRLRWRGYTSLPLLCVLLAGLIYARQQPDPKLAIYQAWNACVETLKEEGNYDDGLWSRLRDSLVHDPPERVKSLDRIAILNELIAIHERRLQALKKMCELERK